MVNDSVLSPELIADIFSWILDEKACLLAQEPIDLNAVIAANLSYWQLKTAIEAQRIWLTSSVGRAK